jgi:hypothetical protein
MTLISDIIFNALTCVESMRLRREVAKYTEVPNIIWLREYNLVECTCSRSGWYFLIEKRPKICDGCKIRRHKLENTAWYIYSIEWMCVMYIIYIETLIQFKWLFFLCWSSCIRTKTTCRQLDKTRWYTTYK